jgi:hypothetical protein
MGRPRKYPESPAVVPNIGPPVPDADPDGPPTPEELEDMEPGQLVTVALEWPRMKITPAMLHALNTTVRELNQADDEHGKSLRRQCISRLGRCGHIELHPGCQMVTIDVPVLKRADGRGGVWYVQINDRRFVGKCEVWECEARTILELVYHYRQVEHDRMSDDNHMIDLDTGGMVAERARAIQRA